MVILSRLWRAFYDPSTYREVASGRTGSCLAHLALAVVLAWLPSLFSMTSGLGKFSRGASVAFAGMPDVHIENGVARLDPPGRHEIALEGDPFLVLDPALSVDDALAYDKGVFLTNRQLVIVRENRADARVVELAQLGDRVITEAEVQGWLAAIGRYGAIFIFPFAVAFLFVWRIFLAALLGLVGLLIARVVGSKDSNDAAEIAFERSFRIATLAVVPGVFLGAIAGTSGRGDWWPMWLSATCAIGYLIFGVRAQRRAVPEPRAA